MTLDNFRNGIEFCKSHLERRTLFEKRSFFDKIYQHQDTSV